MDGVLSSSQHFLQPSNNANNIFFILWRGKQGLTQKLIWPNSQAVTNPWFEPGLPLTPVDYKNSSLAWELLAAPPLTKWVLKAAPERYSVTLSTLKVVHLDICDIKCAFTPVYELKEQLIFKCMLCLNKPPLITVTVPHILYFLAGTSFSHFQKKIFFCPHIPTIWSCVHAFFYFQ